MANFKRGDVIKVPFPCTVRSTRQSRPALVVSSSDLEDTHGLLRVLMITVAENQGWLLWAFGNLFRRRCQFSLKPGREQFPGQRAMPTL